MNTAQTIVASLVGQSITFVPQDKTRVRPITTIKFGEQCELPNPSGDPIPAFNVTLTFSGKRGVIQTSRVISVHRSLEYVAQAADQADQNHEEVVYVAPEPVVKEPKAPKEAKVKEVKEKTKTKKQLKDEAAAAALEAAEEANVSAGDDPFAGEEEFAENPFGDDEVAGDSDEF